jgi:hypothetical protein
LLCAVAFSATAELRFTEVADQAGVALIHEPRGFVDRAGLDFQNHSGPGATFADINLDGWLDLLVSDGYPRGESEISGNHFFLNNGDGSFSELTIGRGVRTGSVANGVVVADMNNDGYSDILFGNHFADPSFLRGGRLGFANLSNNAGLPYLFHTPGTKPEDYTGPRTAGIALGDYDKDGLLDIYMVNQTTKPDLLVHNLDGSFFQATDLIEVFGPGTGFQPVFFDYDSDGDQDIFVVNDVSVDYLYQNNGRSTGWSFTEVASRLKISGGASYSENRSMGMGCSIADFDNDLDEDVYVTNFRINTLYQNPGTWADDPFARFLEVAGVKNVAHDWNGWGCEFFDADNDGDLDLYLVNGWVESALEPRQAATYDNPNVLYENKGAAEDYGFAKVPDAGGAADPAVGRGLAVGDYDRDGDLDMFVTNNTYYENAMNPHIGEPLFWGQHRLYRNDSDNANHWVHFRLQASDLHEGRNKCTRDAIGAKAFVTAAGSTQMRVVRAGSGYQGMSSIELEFGLGAADMVDELRVLWPCGNETTYSDLLPDRRYRVIEDQEIHTTDLSFHELSVRATTPGMLVEWVCSPSLAGAAAWIYRLSPGGTRAELMPDMEVSYEGNRGMSYDTDVELGAEYAYRVVIEGTFGDEHRSLFATANYTPSYQFQLGQNIPNPFNPTTRLMFSLPRAMRARLEILDVRGRRVRLLFDKRYPAGDHEAIWNGQDDRDQPVASGVYVYRLSSEGGAVTRKLTLIR